MINLLLFNWFHIAVSWVFWALISSSIGLFYYIQYSKGRPVKRAVRIETGERHLEKSNIPDMGGIVMLGLFFIFWIFPEIISWIHPEDNVKASLFILFPILFGLIGLADDIVKNRSQTTKGIPARYRIIMQVICAVFFVLYANSTNASANAGSSNLLYLLLLGIIFIPGTVNAANFTDGLDGLLAGIALILSFGFIIVLKSVNPHESLILLHENPLELLVFTGMIIAFLGYNRHPARIFMGDGGSMFIGGFLACYAYENNLMLLLLIMAFPMYFELISVVIQVVSFKLTGKRVFPMTPIHHSFEKWGWSEPKIVWFFYIITFITMLIGVWVVIGFGVKYALSIFGVRY